MLRPLIRNDALDFLLALSVYPGKLRGFPVDFKSDKVMISEKQPRSSSILVLRRWVPDVQPLGTAVVEFARTMLARATDSTAFKAETVESIEAENRPAKIESEEPDQVMADASEKLSTPIMPVVENRVLISGLPNPRTEIEVLQHIELFLGLCPKFPDLLDEYVFLKLWWTRPYKYYQIVRSLHSGQSRDPRAN